MPQANVSTVLWCFWFKSHLNFLGRRVSLCVLYCMSCQAHPEFSTRSCRSGFRAENTDRALVSNELKRDMTWTDMPGMKQRCLEGKYWYDDEWPTRTNQTMNLSINTQPTDVVGIIECKFELCVRSRAATNSNHQPQVLQTTLNMAKSRCKPTAFWCFLYQTVRVPN